MAGVQNKTQLEGTYGNIDARTIMGAFGTRIYMNPQDIETAEWISRGLPEKEVVLIPIWLTVARFEALKPIQVVG